MFISIYKNGKSTLSKTKKSFEKKHVKNIKVFLKKKKTKGEKRSETDSKNYIWKNII